MDIHPMDICKYHEDIFLQAYKTNVQKKKKVCCHLVNKVDFATTVNFTTSSDGYWLMQCCKERKEILQRRTTLSCTPWAASK